MWKNTEVARRLGLDAVGLPRQVVRDAHDRTDDVIASWDKKAFDLIHGGIPLSSQFD